MKIAIPFLLFLAILSCQKPSLSLQEESQIFNEVIPIVLDSIHRSVLPPPLNDAMKRRYENDKMLIFIQDSTEILSKEDQIDFVKDFGNISMDIDSSYVTQIDKDIVKFNQSHEYKLNLNVVTDKFDIRYSFSDTKPNDNLKFCGKLRLSTLRLDNSEKYGVFSVSLGGCHPKLSNRSGYRIYIVKKNGSWKVAKIIDTWVAC